jgi:hypothetical protein
LAAGWFSLLPGSTYSSRILDFFEEVCLGV